MKVPTVQEVRNHYGFCAWVLASEDWRELLRLAAVGQQAENDAHSFNHPDCICGPESPAEHWSTCPCRRQS